MRVQTISLMLMQESGLLSDLRYAKDFVTAKWRAARWSNFKLAHALRQKGVHQPDIDEALAWLQQVSFKKLFLRISFVVTEAVHALCVCAAVT